MDILYYSNRCQHSRKLLQVLSKTDMKDKISFICIDNRVTDNKNQTFIVLNNGSKVIMPPNLVSIPALLMVKNNYKIILGDAIIEHLRPDIITGQSKEVKLNGEPNSYSLNGTKDNIMSESFSSYDLTPNELSAKGSGGRRSMHNYVSVSDDTDPIYTPDDTYNPDKIAGDVTIDTLQQQRNEDIGTTTKQIQPDFTY
jgi:hypothetical protein